MTLTALYPQDADTAFARSLNFGHLMRDMSGLMEYRGLPSGDLFEGQIYSFTPILWTLFHFPQTDVTCVKIDRTTRICANVSTQASGIATPYETRTLSHIIPTKTGCLWTDELEMTGPRSSWLARAMTRYLHKATHRRRGASKITMVIRDH